MSPTTFWTIRLSKPLEFPDLRYCREGAHLQRLFPYRSAFCLTEDVLQDLQQAAAIICWFYSYQKSSPGAYKLVFWPDILANLGKRLADPNRQGDEDGL